MIDLFSSRHVKFKPTRLNEYRGLVTNPSRGWYQVHYFHVPEKPDFEELRWCLRQDESVALAVIHIGAYRDKVLDQDALDTVSAIFDFFSRYEKDLIVRFAYDCEGNGLLYEPTLFSRIEEHVRQLSPVIRAHTKTIFVLQGLFVGSWGEMHGSRFLSPLYLKRLYALAEEAAGEYTYLAVRKPCQWRMLHEPNQRTDRMGLFDDGIFGSESDLGTFGYLEKTQTHWEDAWCPEDELAFEDELCRKVPQGGEAVKPLQLSRITDGDMLRQLRRMHLSYLNCVYDAKLLDIWKQKESPWPGTSLYDYVGAHLGYRFRIRRMKLRRGLQQCLLKLTVENEGFAPCYEEYDVALELVTDKGVLVQHTSWDLRTLASGKTAVWKSALPMEKGELYLSVRRKKDGRVLRFAHEGTEDGKLLLGILK